VTGLTGSAAGAGGSTATLTGTSDVIPFGAPETGFGGASRSHNDDLLLAGVVSLLGAALATTFAIRRRRISIAQDVNEGA
jgi:hypothetical protein